MKNNNQAVRANGGVGCVAIIALVSSQQYCRKESGNVTVLVNTPGYYPASVMLDGVEVGQTPTTVTTSSGWHSIAVVSYDGRRATIVEELPAGEYSLVLRTQADWTAPALTTIQGTILPIFEEAQKAGMPPEFLDELEAAADRSARGSDESCPPEEANPQP